MLFVIQNQEVEYNAINILDKITRDTRDSKNVIVGQSLFEIPQGYVTLNNASGTITVAVQAASGVTSSGSLTVATGESATFRFRRTGSSTYVVYRIA